jgi:DNA invertase Pin-like site-specific DNA recombinase
VSTKEQVDEGNSLSTQQKICLEYAQRHDYEVAEIFIEQGESAKTADRTELQRLLSYCADKKNGIKAVIIYKLDRLSRNTDDYSQLRLLLKRYGVEIKSTSEHFENNPVGRFMENTMANIAQFDNDIRAERSVGGMRDAMRDGRYVWMAPLGYDNIRVGGKATIAQNEKLAPLIYRTFELVASNVYPTEEVRRIITKEGLAGKNGKPLTKGYFYKLLKNELFAGWIIKFGERHKGLFAPIVSEELFIQVQRVLKLKGRKHSAYLTNHPDFPLRKFVVDAEGKKLTGCWSRGKYKKYPYYRFGNNGSNHNRDKFEKTYMNFVDKYSFDDAKLRLLKELVRENLARKTLDQRKETERLKKHITELTEKQSSIIKKNLDGIIPDHVLQQQLVMIDKELLEVNASLATQPSTNTDYEQALELLSDYLRKPSSVWENAKVSLKTRLQVFQFPQGLFFKNGIFGTSETCSFYKAKDAISASKSSQVRLGVQFWNSFAKECDYLVEILKESERQHS